VLSEIAKKAEAVRERADLPLSGDYRGLGGPETVPLAAPKGRPFVAPPATGRNLLDELYLSPSTSQVEAFRRKEERCAK